MYYIFSNRWLWWATAFTASLVEPSGYDPMSASQDTPFMRPRSKDAWLGLEAGSKGPVLGDPCYWRAFSEGERAKEVGLASWGCDAMVPPGVTVWLALTRGVQTGRVAMRRARVESSRVESRSRSRSANLKRQDQRRPAPSSGGLMQVQTGRGEGLAT